jgi:hypothetical protein
MATKRTRKKLPVLPETLAPTPKIQPKSKRPSQAELKRSRVLTANGEVRQSPGLWKTLLHTYRAWPANHAHAAQMTGLTDAECQNVYENGWPKHEWARPIRSILEEEQVLVRAALYKLERDTGGDPAQMTEHAMNEYVRELGRHSLEQAEAAANGRIALAESRAAEIVDEATRAAAAKAAQTEREYLAKIKEAELAAKTKYQKLVEDARMDAAQTSADEALMGRMGRRVAMASQGLAVTLFGDVRVLAEKLSARLDVSKMSGAEAVVYIRTLTTLARESNRTAKLALELERLRVGNPSSIGEEDARDEVPLEEVEERVASINAAVERSRARAEAAGFGVIEGGRTGS